MTYEKHLPFVSTASSKCPVSWGSSNEYFMVSRSWWDAFEVLSWQFWSTVLRCSARLPIQTFGFQHFGLCSCALRVCNLSQRQPVAVVCVLYKNRSNPMHPFCAALPEPLVPMRVTRNALVAHRYTFAFPRCKNSQYRRAFISHSVAHSMFDGVGQKGFNGRVNVILLTWAALSLLVFHWFIFLFLSSMGWLCGVGSLDVWRASFSLSLPWTYGEHPSLLAFQCHLLK